MTHEELLAKIDHMWDDDFDYVASCHTNALRAVVQLHSPEPINNNEFLCAECNVWGYPCPTIQAIERELK